MKIIGITGQSGSGKTTLCNILEENYNSKVIDADKIAKELSNDNSSEYYKEIVNLFGENIKGKNGMLNRKKMADIIYSNKVMLEKLNELTFKFVVDEINRRIDELENIDYCAVDAPLLYEAGIDKRCDFVIAVIANNENRINRICIRDGIEKEIASQRLNIQNSDDFYIERADFVIYNDNEKEHLKDALKKILEEI